ncbi:MAG: hypothetical protein WAV41_01770 [Microgenomates group bacterium]
MKSKITSIIITSFPVFLVTVFPILFFCAHNISELSLVFLRTPLLLSLSISFLLTAILYYFVHPLSKTVVLSTTIIFIFFSYGHLSQSLTDKLFIPLPGGLVIGPDKILLPLIFILFIFFSAKVIKSTQNFSPVINFLNIFLFILCLSPLYTIITIEAHRKNSQLSISSPATLSSSQLSNLPDVYHIILDGYARNDILSNIYQYDNSAFTSSLKKMGFYVATDARTNYFHTYLSLPSTFNMTFLDKLVDQYGPQPVDGSAAKNMMLHNLVSQKFKSYGYQTINFVSDWEGTNENYPADIVYRDGRVFKVFGLSILASETNMVFLRTTLLSPLISEVWESAIRQKTLSVFEKMPDVAYLDGPKYVLAHIMSPHPPYVFQEDGSPVTDPRLVNADEGIERRPFYLDQLKFISRQTIVMIQKIISNSRQPPIIILQSDHGPASIFGSRQDWKSHYSLAALNERSGILYAILLPDKNYQHFSPVITPVNTYRILFNQYFGENNTILPNKTYYTNYDKMYGFSDITQFITPQ